jgi:hypothetical protein
MRTILFCIFVSSLCLPASVSAQLTPDEQEELEMLEALMDVSVERTTAQTWCFEYRYGRSHCFTLNMLVEHMLEIAQSRAIAQGVGEHEWAEHFQAMFDEARDGGVQGWCERRRQGEFDLGNTANLSCRSVNEVFVVTYKNQDNQTRIYGVASNIRQAWSWIQLLQEFNRDGMDYRNIQLTKLIYSPRAR